MNLWVNALKAFSVKPGRLSKSSALENVGSITFILALFLMPVLAFISGGAMLDTGEWMVLPFGSAPLVFGLIILADYLPRFITLLAILGIFCTIGLGIWFGMAHWWDTGGIAKACLTGMHTIMGFALLLRALTH